MGADHRPGQQLTDNQARVTRIDHEYCARVTLAYLDRIKYKTTRSNTVFDIAESVRVFNKAFNHPAPERVTHVDEDTAQLRYDLIDEEARELGEAYFRYPARAWGAKAKYAPNITEIFDACLDQIVIAVGTMVVHGFSNQQIYAGLEEVMRSNMTKLDQAGQPIYKTNGKIAKSDQYEEPNLKPIIGRIAL